MAYSSCSFSDYYYTTWSNHSGKRWLSEISEVLQSRRTLRWKANMKSAFIQMFPQLLFWWLPNMSFPLICPNRVRWGSSTAWVLILLLVFWKTAQPNIRPFIPIDLNIPVSRFTDDLLPFAHRAALNDSKPQWCFDSFNSRPRWWHHYSNHVST